MPNRARLGTRKPGSVAGHTIGFGHEPVGRTSGARLPGAFKSRFEGNPGLHADLRGDPYQKLLFVTRSCFR